MSGEQLSVIGEEAVASIKREITDIISTILPTILSEDALASIRKEVGDIVGKILPTILREALPTIMLTEFPKILVGVMEEMKRIDTAKKEKN